MLDLFSAAQALGARMVGGNAEFTRVTTDSRDIRPGDLFVGIRGKRFDGQEFAAQALAAGAVAALISDESPVTGPASRLLVVRDTRLALGQLAAYWRARFAIPLIAITGSNGKTTVKEMLAAILRLSTGENGVLATADNLNNDIGMPLTLLRLRNQHRCAVVEMGMNHLGEISYLSRLAKPTAALITNAGTAHIGELGSLEAIARAKGEIFEGLDKAGTAIINSDDAFADFWRNLAKPRQVLSFGLESKAAVSARYELAEAGSLITIMTSESHFVATLNVPGLHNVKNALAAAAAAHALGIDAKAIAAGMADFRGIKGRLQRKRLPTGATLIDDTYNANPDSMRAAIAVLSAHTGPKVFVMGDMGELGETASAMHAEVGEFAKRAGVDRLFALGDMSAEAVRGFGDGGVHFLAMEDLLDTITSVLTRDTALLIKGSRFMRMERVVEALGALNGEQTAKGGA